MSTYNNFNNYTPEIPYTDELPPASVISSRKKKEEEVVSTKVKRTKKGKKEQSKKPNNIGNNRNDDSVFQVLKEFFTGTSMKLIVGIFLGCLCIYMGVAFISYFASCIADQSAINSAGIGYAVNINNTAGEGGARLSEFLINESFGLGSFVIVIWLGAMSLKLLLAWPRFKSVNFTIKCFVALVTISLIVGLATIGAHSPVNWGGYHGRYVNEFIIHFVGGIGAVLLCIFMIALFVVICLNDLIKWIMKQKRKRDERRRMLAEEKAEKEAREAAMRKMQEEEKIEDLKAGETVALETQEMPEEPESTVSFEDKPIYTIDGPTDDIESTDAELPSEEIPAEETDTIAPASDGEVETIPEAEDVQAPSDMDKMVVNVNHIDEVDKPHYTVGNSPRDNYPYEFPPFEILRPGIDKISVDADEQIENKEKIRTTLLDFGIPITRIEATIGPTITLYEIVPDKGVKISKIRSLVDDIALRISAKGVRIIAPIPGKGTVGIEVANKDPQVVSMRTIIKSKKFQESKYTLPIAIGSTISNDVYIADLAKMPHLLVAGATGQGKSVGLNAIIASLLYCKRPNELKFVMIDPKQVEFSLYNRIKDHYMAVIPENEDEEPVITDMAKVEATLNSLCIEMDDRYNLLKNAHTRNIEEYNAKYKAGKLNPEEGHKFLPYIVVVVDEFGDLIMVSGKNVEMPIARLAQKARAVGMHVIIATQRPSINVITGIIKANFPARMSFKVSSGADSKTILDTTGAQQLIGRGDMLIFNNSEMVRVQCAFIDTPEVEAICQYVGEQPYAQGVYLLPEPQLGEGEGVSGGSGGNVSDRDPLFEEVARQVVNSNTASTSSLQRNYSIGYNRAGRIMDQLEAAGIVGASQGGKPRAVLVNQSQLESILNS